MEPSEVEARLKKMRVIWAAMLGSVALYALLGVAVLRPDRAEATAAPGPAVAPGVFVLLGLAIVAASFAVRRFILRRSVEQRRPELVLPAVLAGVAISEAAALLGLVVLAVTGSSYSYLLLAVGALGIILHAPRREDLTAAGGGAGGAGNFGR